MSGLKLKIIIYIFAAILAYLAIESFKNYATEKYDNFIQAKAEKKISKAKITIKELENQRSEIAINSNLQLKKNKELIKSLEQNSIAREKEIKWAIWRNQQLEKKLKEEKIKNDNLQKILDSRIPASVAK